MSPELGLQEALERLEAFDFRDDALEVVLAGLGTSMPEFFEQTHAGGIVLQQIPGEFAQLLRFLRRCHPGPAAYLEIGIDKGGPLRVLDRFWRHLGARPTICVADNFSYDSEAQQAAFELLKRDIPLEAFIGDTRSEAFRRFLDGRTFDVAFIDGDHSFRGSLSDALTVLPHLTKRGTMIFHDVAGSMWPGVAATASLMTDCFHDYEYYVHGQACGIAVFSRPRRRSLRWHGRRAVRRYTWRFRRERALKPTIGLVKRAYARFFPPPPPEDIGSGPDGSTDTSARVD